MHTIAGAFSRRVGEWVRGVYQGGGASDSSESSGSSESGGGLAGVLKDHTHGGGGRGLGCERSAGGSGNLVLSCRIALIWTGGLSCVGNSNFDVNGKFAAGCVDCCQDFLRGLPDFF